jgi:hypothetical protein
MEGPCEQQRHSQTAACHRTQPVPYPSLLSRLRSRWISPTKALAITDEASPFALRSTRNRLRGAMHHGCVSSHRRRGGSSDCCRQRAATVAGQTANRSRWSPRIVFLRPRLVIYWQIAGKRRFGALRACNRPGGGPGLSCWFVVEPPPESNRRSHPYHGTTRNRCANRHSPRSRPTVGPEVIGSPSAKLCALSEAMCWSRCSKPSSGQGVAGSSRHSWH